MSELPFRTFSAAISLTIIHNMANIKMLLPFVGEGSNNSGIGFVSIKVDPPIIINALKRATKSENF
jgi:hypothetical protein